MKPKVSVYIPNHNYSNYLSQAIDSVVDQNYDNWELIIILDAPIDDSHSLIKSYQEKLGDKIRIFENKKKKGLQYCANLAIKEAKGDYIIRLDSDDFFNESALRIMSSFLDDNPDVAMVYPDYFYIDQQGNFLDIDTRKKLGEKDLAFDLPAHGACSMIRLKILNQLGGYSENFNAQDGYDLWYKILENSNMESINTPLFYYRQHKSSLSQDSKRILKARQKIKRHYANKKNENFKLAIVIGAKKNQGKIDNVLSEIFKNNSLLNHTLLQARAIKNNSKILISTDDESIDTNLLKDNEIIHRRNKKFNSSHTTRENIINDAVETLEKNFGFYPDIVIFLNCLTPLRNIESIQEGIDTLILHDFDSVISVYEDLDLHFFHSIYGLEAISKRRHKELRIEREALYVDNRAFIVARRKSIKKNSSSGKKIGHVVMSREDSLNIRSPRDLKIAEIQ
jgi:glycosyltransferase involved in cell wall biosynthesis|tara:strand:+ start:2242 stop:3597 length:1356 start_codon:yes stop_codon:yes gene_type:complete